MRTYFGLLLLRLSDHVSTPHSAIVHAGVHQFFNIIPILSWDKEAADHYAEIRHELTYTGQLIGDPDMMIAAHAQAISAVLVSNNIRHFERIASKFPLVLENWARS